MDLTGPVFFDCVKGHLRDPEKLKNCYFGHSHFLAGNVRKFIYHGEMFLQPSRK